MRKINTILILLIALSFTSCYDFNREQNELDAESNGRAILLEAESSKKAAIEEAKARKESAALDAETKLIQEQASADARVIEAKSIAEANRLIGESLRNNDAYLKYLMITGMSDAKSRIYIPTEAGLPILEAK